MTGTVGTCNTVTVKLWHGWGRYYIDDRYMTSRYIFWVCWNGHQRTLHNCVWPVHIWQDRQHGALHTRHSELTSANKRRFRTSNKALHVLRRCWWLMFSSRLVIKTEEKERQAWRRGAGFLSRRNMVYTVMVLTGAGSCLGQIRSDTDYSY